ncbi:hypothetical protein BJ875DRAFT_208778 [Amylocarpus encephaloides]|uniref:MINDY deubiquitinase domain-containing protein n=1 Tax=Amylocarpus encephaloides TaxID=45428 RepID=A0A9P7Y8H7_9HELO|nr:hypothetical protein BJ875DRAFT_208778 [Amylocarpus encephaloides]
MVTRKPVPQSDLGPDHGPPPYPVTPIPNEPPRSFRVQDARQGLRTSVTDSEPDILNVWGDEGFTAAGAHGNMAQDTLPESLRIGPAGLSNAGSREGLRSDNTSTNPFLKSQGQARIGKESSADAWGQPSELSADPPAHAPLPEDDAPSKDFAKLSVSEPNTNPWQPALDVKSQVQLPPIPNLRHEDSGNEAWASPPPARPAPEVLSEVSQPPVLVNIDGPESPAWDEDEPSPVMQDMPVSHAKESQQIADDRHAWDDNEGHSLQQGAAVAGQFVAQDDPLQPHDGWNLIDHETVASGAQQSGIVSSDGTALEPVSPEGEPGPALPPRRSIKDPPIQPPRPQEQPPTQPPRPTIITETRSASSVPSQELSSAVRSQKKETYEIKKINWYDVNAAQNPRVSPILVQNANGPCPLLALVNALTLSTPANVETALVDTLRSREQVSLGLLLDAVFDELMSGRRGDAAQELPDVSDLYSFLITLHTGMNVNPRFFPPAPTKSANDPRNSMSHVHPSEREDGLPGTFEETREMALYGTFSVPLIHGWIPERDSPACVALSRSAKSYEDAQNLMFNEEVLEEKLRHEGLSFEEQAILEDIGTIKAFFSSNATQLTSFGLDTITASVAPGAIAILFRNDHFSTLYRHPQTLQLLQLVTDMGYAGHEEVVWESLIDVNGENAEFFSGDFRLVGGAPTTSQATAHESRNGWAPVTGRRGSSLQNATGRHQSTPSSSSLRPEPTPEPPHSPNIEQEDHDLALALQLQEEEEQRHEQEVARRRRETELSQQFIEQQGRGQGARNNNVPVSRGRGQPTRGRGAGRGAAIESRPTIPPRRNGQQTPIDPEAGVNAPPPSYEQAATQPAYAPPANHPAHPSSAPSPANSTGRRMSAYSSTATTQPSPAGRGRRATGTAQTFDQMPIRRPAVQQQPERDRDCVVM